MCIRDRISSRQNALAPSSSVSRTTRRCAQPAASTVGSGAKRSVPPAPTWAVTSSSDSPGPGRTSVAATEPSSRVVPGATYRSSASLSPPSGPAAVETRWTVCGPVWRSVSGGAEARRLTTVRPSPARAVATAALARITRRVLAGGAGVVGAASVGVGGGWSADGGGITRRGPRGRETSRVPARRPRRRPRRRWVPGGSR